MIDGEIDDRSDDVRMSSRVKYVQHLDNVASFHFVASSFPTRLLHRDSENTDRLREIREVYGIEIIVIRDCWLISGSLSTGYFRRGLFRLYPNSLELEVVVEVELKCCQN